MASGSAKIVDVKAGDIDGHTPTPWVLRDHSEGALWIEDEIGMAVASLPDWLPEVGNPRKANAALIVRAVNHHAELVAALQAMVDAYKDKCPDDEQPSMVRQALAVLAKVAA